MTSSGSVMQQDTDVAKARLEFEAGQGGLGATH